VKAIAQAHVKTDKIDAGTLASLQAAGYLPQIWTPDAGTERKRRLVARRYQVVRHRTRLKNEMHSILMVAAQAERRHDTPLPGGIGKELGGAFGQPHAGIGDDQPDALEAAFLEMLEEAAPARLVFLGAFADAENLPIPIAVDTDRNEERHVADLAGPAALKHDAVEIHVGMLALDRLVTPCLARAVIFLFRSDSVEGDTRVPHSASVMSSTRRTETPARYISIKASSTELSRRR
jgi:hypothetical protein